MSETDGKSRQFLDFIKSREESLWWNLTPEKLNELGLIPRVDQFISDALGCAECFHEAISCYNYCVTDKQRKEVLFWAWRHVKCPEDEVRFRGMLPLGVEFELSLAGRRLLARLKEEEEAVEESSASTSPARALLLRRGS